MTDKDKLQFKKILFGLAKIFPTELDGITIGMYFSALSDLSIEQLGVAANKLVRTGKFFPKPVEIRELCLESNRLLAEEAWVEVLSEISRGCGVPGAHQSFSTPEIEFAVRSIGGLNSIWQAGCEQESYYRHNFIAAYNNVAQRADSEALQGLPDHSEAVKSLNYIKRQIGGNGESHR